MIYNPFLMWCTVPHLHMVAIALQWSLPPSLSLSLSPYFFLSHPAVPKLPEGLAVCAAAGNRQNTQTAHPVLLCVYSVCKLLIWHS